MKEDNISDRISGIFLFGMVSGVFVSYSGFLSYITGVCTGIIVARKFEYVSNQITDKVTYMFDNIVKQIKDFKND